MGFAGNLRTLPLPDVVQTLGRIQATGVLRLAAQEASRDVIFKDGIIIGVGFREGAERQALLQRLIMQGHLDATSAAAISAAGSESQVVRTLVAQGYVDEDEVHDARLNQAEEELYALVTLESADFVFHDAIPDEPEICAIVTRHEKLGLSINGEKVLMESARRMDEWNRLKSRISEGSAVFGSSTGREDDLAKAGEEYPAKAVVPLIDAIRTVDDIVEDAVIGRLEVYQVLVSLLDDGLLAQLSRDDLLAHADYWKEQHDNRMAARLYRRALALQPSDKVIQSKLGACLEYVGEGEEAAACYDQLALGLLDERVADRASEYARHAISLIPTEPKYRLTLVRSLVMLGDRPGAVGELQRVVTAYLELGQLEDARGTCLKILELSKDDEFARRELARIFSRVEHDQESEDVVVCVNCNHVNHREAVHCAQCQTDLTLTCLSCNRVVAVSDRMCIFCGADPHLGRNRTAGGKPTTSRIIRRSAMRQTASGIRAATAAAAAIGNPTPGTQRAHGSGNQRAVKQPEAPDLVSQALAQEEAGNLSQALDLWRMVAKQQPGDANLIAHLKQLERAINQEAVEAQIDLGHRLHRTRHLFKAVRAYKAALRAMASDDPRVKPVSEALARTEREQRRLGLVYGGALVVILVLLGVAVRPYWQYRGFSQRAELTQVRVQALGGLNPTELSGELTAITGELDELDQRVSAMTKTHEKAKQAAAELASLSSDFTNAKAIIGHRSLDQLEKTIGERQIEAANSKLLQHQAAFSREIEPDRLDRLTKALQDLKQQLRVKDDQAKEAPKQLELAKTHEEAGRLADALAVYRQVAGTSNAEAAAEAKAASDRLAPGEQAFATRWSKLVQLGTSDWSAALALSREMLPESRKWGKAKDAEDGERQLVELLAKAEAAWTKLGEDATDEQLTTFLRDHPGAPQRPLAEQRRQTVRERMVARDKLYEAWRGHVQAKRWADAWQSGRDLAAGYGSLLPAGSIWIPVQIESQPVGATVSIDGTKKGVTPLVLQVRPPMGKAAGDDGELVVSAPGWNPVTLRLAQAANDWRSQVALSRATLWRLAFGRPVGGLHLLGDQIVALGNDSLAAIDAGGRIRWRYGLGGDDLGTDRLPPPPALLPDGRVAVIAGTKLAVINAEGSVIDQFDLGDEVRARPLPFVNEAFGGESRVAAAGTYLNTGALSQGARKRLTLPRAALAGPVLAGPDLDRLLVLALEDGRLMGVRESQSIQQGKAVAAFELDLQATDISQFTAVTGAVGETTLLTVLDGAKLASVVIRGEKASIWWIHDLKAPAVGEPAVADGVVYQAAGRTLQHLSLSGAAEAPLSLPSPATSGAAARGDLAAVGCQDGTLLVWRRSQVLWSTSCGAPVTAVTITKDRIIVGLQDGTILAFAP